MMHACCIARNTTTVVFCCPASAHHAFVTPLLLVVVCSITWQTEDFLNRTPVHIAAAAHPGLVVVAFAEFGWSLGG